MPVALLSQMVTTTLSSKSTMTSVLVQLPKKDAGAGLAFGGGTTEALFGAGSGNMLTKITKYAAVAFFVLTMSVAVLQSKIHHSRTLELERLLEQPAATPAAAPSSGQPLPPTSALPETAPPTAPATVPGAPAATEPN